MITTTERPAAELAIRWPAPVLSRGRESLQRAGDRLWRVLDERGSIRGHLRLVPDALGVRYQAERLRPQSGTFLVVGEFWNPDDAVAALRF